MMWIWEIFVAVWNFTASLVGLMTSTFWILLGVLMFFRDDVRDAFTKLILTMGHALHVHIYVDKKGWVRHNWGGLLAYRKERRCRCGATKVKVRGLLE